MTGDPSEEPGPLVLGVLVLVGGVVVALGIGALGLWWAVTEQRRGDTAPGITYALIVLGVFTACLVAVGLLLLPVVGLVKIVSGHEPGDWLNAVAVVLCPRPDTDGRHKTSLRAPQRAPSGSESNPGRLARPSA